MLTPLPGTDFYEEIKDRLLTNDYDFFDFIHTLLPTDLPLDDFYEECYQLSTKSASPSFGGNSSLTGKKDQPQCDRQLMADLSMATIRSWIDQGWSCEVGAGIAPASDW